MGSRPPRLIRSASSTRTQVSASPCDFRHAVMLRQHGIDEGVVAIQQVQHRAVVVDHVLRNRIGSWNIASRRSLVKLGKRSRSTELMVFEMAEIEPVAAEFGGQAAHRSSFSMRRACGQQHVGLLQIARRRVLQQFLVGHAGPRK